MPMKDRSILHDTSAKAWKAVGSDIFRLNNKTYLCTVDYHRMLPIMKLTDGLRTEIVIKTCICLFEEYRLFKKK